MATLQTTPATFDAVRKTAKPGDVLVNTGIYPAQRLKTLVGITFRGGTFKGLVFDDCRDLTLDGVSIAGPGEEGLPLEGHGIDFNRCSNVALTNSTIAGTKAGVVCYLTDGFRVVGNHFTRLRSDGLDIALSWNGVVEANTFTAFTHAPADHPDAIQMWSRPEAKPVCNIVIRRNVIVLNGQGISLFNHIRDGVDDGGGDNITIEDNTVVVGFPNAIALGSVRGGVVRNNRVSTLTGAKFRASINVDAGTERSGNSVAAGAGKAAASDPVAPPVVDMTAQLTASAAKLDAALLTIAEARKVLG